MADDMSCMGSQHLLCINTCICSLKEMELSSIVAHKVLKQLWYLMQQCNLQFVSLNAQVPENAIHSAYQSLITEYHPASEGMGQGLSTLAVPDADASSSHDFL